MDTCPICDHPQTGSLIELLRRIGNEKCDNRALQVMLACDIAKHVCNLAPDPAQLAKWLAIAQAWEKDPVELGQISEESYAQHSASWATARDTANTSAIWATMSAIGAAVAATKGKKDLETFVRATATLAAAAVGGGPEEDEEERAWQIAHIRELACTCPTIPEGDRTCQRGRNSILAH
jgi:hypothetical protein